MKEDLQHHKLQSKKLCACNCVYMDKLRSAPSHPNPTQSNWDLKTWKRNK